MFKLTEEYAHMPVYERLELFIHNMKIITHILPEVDTELYLETMDKLSLLPGFDPTAVMRNQVRSNDKMVTFVRMVEELQVYLEENKEDLGL